MTKQSSEIPVLIVGGGPIGLALAADLGRRGVETLLVDRRENKLQPPKMLEVSSRTMEFCRQLGIVEKVRNWGFPSDRPLDSVFVTDLQGYEIGRVRTPSLAAQSNIPVSPERGMPCPQTWFDPILQEHARSFPHVTLRHHVKLEDFVQDRSGVTATLRDEESGHAETVRATISRRLRRHYQHSARIAWHRNARRAADRLGDDGLSAHARTSTPNTTRAKRSATSSSVPRAPGRCSRS